MAMARWLTESIITLTAAICWLLPPVMCAIRLFMSAICTIANTAIVAMTMKTPPNASISRVPMRRSSSRPSSLWWRAMGCPIYEEVCLECEL